MALRFSATCCPMDPIDADLPGVPPAATKPGRCHFRRRFNNQQLRNGETLSTSANNENKLVPKQMPND